MRILIPTDVFPPGGGAAWSTHALARALIEREHTVNVVVPQRGKQGYSAENAFDVPTVRWGYKAPKLPFVQNYARYERLWPRLADWIVEQYREQPPDLIHAQHVQTSVPAILAAKRLKRPVVVTIRDHWPWDYFTLGLHGDHIPYPGQSWASLATELPARLGPLKGSLALPAIPYMRAHLKRRQRYLAQADAVVAVSNYIAERLEGIVPADRIHVVPNLVDLAQIEQIVAEAPQNLPDEPFLLYVGKLEPNKGAGLLGAIFQAYRLQGHAEPPRLLICGNGPLQAKIERDLQALGVRYSLLQWVDHNEVLRLMARCELLLFPSLWGEALSRVLLEASAARTTMLAMPTGGTRDIIEDGVSGALAATPQLFASRMAELLNDAALRRRLAAGAYQKALSCFAKPVVVERFETLYRGLIDRSAALA